MESNLSDHCRPRDRARHARRSRRPGSRFAAAALLGLAACGAIVYWSARDVGVSDRHTAASITRDEIPSDAPTPSPTESNGAPLLEGANEESGSAPASDSPSSNGAQLPELMLISGIVTGIDGSPVAGATVYWTAIPSAPAAGDEAIAASSNEAQNPGHRHPRSTNALPRRLLPASSTASGADGTYALWAPRSPVLVVAKTAGYRSSDVEVPVPPDVPRPIDKDSMAPEIRVDLTLRIDGASISGRVFDATTGLGVAEVTVFAFEDDERDQGFQRKAGPYRPTTDGDGNFSLRGLHQPVLYLAVFGAKTRYLDTPPDQRVKVTLSEVEHKQWVDLPCELGGVISGVVVGPDGAPESKAYVWATPERTAEGQALRMRSGPLASERAVRTDEAGNFQTAGLEFGYEYILHVTRPGLFAPYWSEPLLVTRGQPEQFVNVALSFGARVAGVVLWDDGSPAADIEVAADVSLGARHAPYLHFVDRFRYAPQRTDQEGAFAFENVGKGPHWVRLPAYTQQPWNSERAGKSSAVLVEVPEDCTGITLVIHRPDANDSHGPNRALELVSGTVTTSNGNPVSEATIIVQVERADSRYALESAITTDEFGAFETTVRSTGPCRVSASRQGYQDSKVDDVLPGDRDVRLVLERLASISGRVMTPDGQAPAGSFRVAAVPIHRNRDSARATAILRDSATSGREDGTFQLAHVPAGLVRVVAGTQGFAIGRSEPIEAALGALIEGVTIRVTPGGAVRGTVTAIDGSTVRDAKVLLLAAENGAKFSFGRPDTACYATATTAEDGSYSLECLEAGAYEICAINRDRRRSSIARVTVEEGAVLDAPPLALLPAGSLAVEIVEEPREDQISGAMLTLEGKEQRERRPSGAEGKTRFDYLAPGEYEVLLELLPGERPRAAARRYVVSMGANEERQLRIPIGSGPRLHGRITGIPAGRTVNVVLEPIAREVGRPAPAPPRRLARAGADYSFEDVEPGLYRLEVAPQYSVAIEVSGHDLEQNIDLQP